MSTEQDKAVVAALRRNSERAPVGCMPVLLGTPHHPWTGDDTPMGSWHHADEHQEQT